MNEIKLYLIRHGKTYCNVKNLYCGKSDVDLSENGIYQLRENAKKNEYPKCDFYFTSGAKRANQTLEIICPGNKYNILADFFEYDFGDFELKGHEDIKSKKEYMDWMEDTEGNIRCPNGESKSEFRKRIKEGFTELVKYFVKEDIKTAIGVTHGGTIGMILEMLYDEKKKFYEWQPENGQGYELSITVDGNGEFKIDKVIKKGGMYD